MEFKCTICGKQGDFWQDLEYICVTKCGHLFHLNCVMTLSLKPKSMIDCPMLTCNKKIKQSTVIQIDPSVIETRKKNNENDQPIDCALCNSAVEDPENISITKCGHLHHCICLEASVGPKSYPCLVPSCKKKITRSSITQIRLTHRSSPAEELQALLMETSDAFKTKIEPKTEYSPSTSNKNSNSPSTSSKKLSKSTLTQKYPAQDKKRDVKPEISQAQPSAQLLPPLLLNKTALCGEKNEKLSQQINNDLERECLMNMLDKGTKPKNEISENQEIVELQQENTVLVEKMEALDKERNDAKKETAIWEMSFKYLQENFENTDLMIPNEKTLQLIKENEKLRLNIQEMKKERDDAKKDTKIWEMSYSYLQETFKGTDLMVPDEKTLNIIKENENLKICIQDLGSKLASAKKDVNSAESLRSDLENYVEENLNLKNENEEMKRDLKTVRDEIIKLDSTVTDIVMRNSQETDTLNELNHSLLKENTRLDEINETLQTEKDKLNELNELNQTLKNEINKLNELNNTLQKDKKKLNESNNSLLKENKELHELNGTLLKENSTLNVLTTSLQEDNQEINKPNPALLEKLLGEIARLNELNETLKNDNRNLEKLNESLQKKRNKSVGLVLSQKEKRDIQWELICRRHSNSDGDVVATKRRASEMGGTTSETQANTDHENEETVKKEVVNEKCVNHEVGSKETEHENTYRENGESVIKEVVTENSVNNDEVVSERAIKRKVVSKEDVNEDDVNTEAGNEEPVTKKIKLENEKMYDGASVSSIKKLSEAINRINDTSDLG